MTKDEQIAWGWSGKGYVPISLEQFNDIWYRQEGKCAGCRQPLAHPVWKQAEFGLRPEVDHRHTGEDCQTQDVRGLLCRACNYFLGKIRDNQETLRNLAGYLKDHGDSLL